MELETEALSSLDEFVRVFKDIITDKAEELSLEKKRNVIDVECMQKAILIVLVKKGTLILDSFLAND